MIRSWGYILMVIATLAGGSALLWPSPEAPQIEEITAPIRAPKPEASARPAKASAKPEKSPKAAAREEAAPAPEPPSMAKRIPAQNTPTRRAAPTAPAVQNGLQPNMFGNPVQDGKLPRQEEDATKRGPGGIWGSKPR